MKSTTMLYFFCSRCILLVLMANNAHSQCVTDNCTRTAHFEGCPSNMINNNGLIGQVEDVSSLLSCAAKCMFRSDCSSFNTKKVSDMSCQLSSVYADCSNLTTENGSQTFNKHAEPFSCNSRLRVVLKTDKGTPIRGSIGNLRNAVLKGAKLTVLVQPYLLPQSLDSYIYAVDSVQISGNIMNGHVYTFEGNYDTLYHLTHVKISSTGYVDWSLSNGTNRKENELSITWVAQDTTEKCNLVKTGTTVEAPAFILEGNEKEILSGSYSEFQSMLSETMAVIQAVRHVADTSAWSFQLTPFDVSYGSVIATTTWMPVNGLDVLVLGYDFFRSKVEEYGILDTMVWAFKDGYEPSPSTDLEKIEFYVDPCWTLLYTKHSDGKVEGNIAKLVSRVDEGANLAIRIFDTTRSMYLVGEHVSRPNDNRAWIDFWGKMGVTPDEGASWSSVYANSDGHIKIGDDIVTGLYSVSFYTDNRQRPYRYIVENGVTLEGSFEGAKVRLESGLIPRVMVLYPWWCLYVDVESVQISSDGSTVVLLSYRVPEGGYMIRRIELRNMFYSVTKFQPDKYDGDYFYPQPGKLISLKLYFEEF